MGTKRSIITLTGKSDEQRTLALQEFAREHGITSPIYQTPMSPPWITFPDLPRMSIGWRMGGGESYWIAFMDWYNSLSDVEQELYGKKNPEPKDWHGFYELIRKN